MTTVELMTKDDIYQLICSSGTSRDLTGRLREFTSLSRLKHHLSTHRRGETYHVENYRETREKIREWVEAESYMTFPLSSIFNAVLDSGKGYISSYITVSSGDSGITVNGCGDRDIINKFFTWTDVEFKREGAYIYTATKLDPRSGNVVTQSHYDEKTTSTLANQSFYPWFEINLAEYFDLFMTSPEAILVLFGPPGTGKSTFIRSLIHSKGYKALLAYNQEVIQSPVLLEAFHSNEADLLIYEDVDKYLRDRDAGENGLMSSLLNASEGVLKRPKKKIVISTNLPSIDKIDPALLRVGRCFDIVEFRELTSSEARTVLSDCALPPKNLDSKNSWTLAEVLSQETLGRQAVNRFKRRMGF